MADMAEADNKVVKLKFPCGHKRWPLLAEMNDRFIEQWTPKQVNEWLKTRNAPVLSPSKLSRHRRECLSLAKLTPAAGRRVVMPAESLKDQPVPTTDDLRREGLRIFYYRMRERPESISNQQLVPILLEAMRGERGGGKPKEDPMDEVLRMMAEEESTGRGDEGELHAEPEDQNDRSVEGVRQAAQ